MKTLRPTGHSSFLFLAVLGLASCGFRAAGQGSEWGSVMSTPDPVTPMLSAFRKSVPDPVNVFSPTGLTGADYLKLISGEIDFWKSHQDASGAIIDPYKHAEWQYSTPAFANAAAALVHWNNRQDLIEPAAKALDWAVLTLSQRRAATSHEDFFSVMIAHAMMLLKPHVPQERYDQWAAEIKGFDPFLVYHMAPGSMNWNIVSSVGEAFYGKMGLRSDNSYVETSFGAQGRHFTSPHGLYLEGPMAYDLFPRMFLDDLIAQGYAGPYAREVGEMVRRGAITSLFMESPCGELPLGGRSAQHNWNEAEEAAVFEIQAAEAQKVGDRALAGIYKRAAHLAFRSMLRWVRPSGEMQTVKNWVNPERTFGYEVYSAHSQYNLLPMAMLAMAYGYAHTTDGVAEVPAPADVGGYVLDLPELHKVFANAAGTYVEIETGADPHYDATGLIRVQMTDIPPQLGPSDSLVAHRAYHVEPSSTIGANTGIGVAWKDASGTWRRVGELTKDNITKATVSVKKETPGAVDFAVAYEGDLFGAKGVTEHYSITPGNVNLTSEVAGYNGPLRYLFPVSADDGRTKTKIEITPSEVSVTRPQEAPIFNYIFNDAGPVSVGPDLYPNHNGWSRLGVAEFPKGGSVSITISYAVNAD
jgi:hypothetical protein